MTEVSNRELKTAITDLTAAVTSASAKLNTVSYDVSQLKTKLLGIPEMKLSGMIDQFEDMKGRVDKHDSDIKDMKDNHFKQKVIIGAGSAAIGGSAGIMAKTSIITKIIAFLALR